MIKITCDMCMDLMPLVQDGVASEDSIAAVEQHIKTCSECKSVFEVCFGTFHTHKPLLRRESFSLNTVTRFLADELQK